MKCVFWFFFFKQKTAYEMRISDWSSDVCSSDLEGGELKDADYRTRVTMTFKGLDDGRTLVEIAEEGWRENQGALGASYGNCQGWSQMLCALKEIGRASCRERVCQYGYISVVAV